MGGKLARGPRVRSLQRAVITVSLLVACTSDTSGPPHPVASVDVTPPAASIPITTAVQFTAVPRDAQGGALNGRTITWSSSDTTVATTSAGGLVTGVSLGSVTITASAEGHAGTTTVGVVPGPAVGLLFTSQPSTVTAGVPLTPPIQITAQDIRGNTATGFTGSVTVSIAANPSGGTLSGTKTIAAVAGVATFSDLRIDKSGSGYTLQASSGTLSAVSSGVVNVSPGPAAHLRFAVQPSTTAAGASITPAVVAQARDAFDNAVPGFHDTVAIALGANPTAATLLGTTKALAVGGVASFPGLHLTRSGTGYTLAATAPGLGPDSSATFAITAGPVSAAQSSLSVAPASISASSGSSAATITVTVHDGFGNAVSGAPVVLSATGTGNTLVQPAALTDANGVATATLSSTMVESKTVTATAGGVALPQSAVVTVTPAAAATLVFTVQPGGGAAGAIIAPPIQVSARDAFGNPATGFSSGITVALGANPGGAVLSGTLSRTATAGVATFNDLSLDKAGTGYTLTASATGTTSATSSAFGIGAGAVSAAKSTLQVAPTTLVASGGSSAATISVIARDAFGNPVPGVTVVLAATGSGNTLTQPAGPTDAGGAATGTLSSTGAGLKTVSATVNGIPLTSQPTVTVNAGPVSGTTSTVVGAPTSIQASDGGFSSTITVTALDAFSNPVAGATVVLAATGTGNTLTQPTGTTSAVGEATGVLSSTTTGTKVVSATINGGPVAQTASVTVLPGEVSVTRTTFVTTPVALTASTGSSAATITVTARDDHGNPIPGIAVALTATGTGNALGQPAGLTDANGVATGSLYSTRAELKVISAVVGGTGLDQLDSVTVAPGPPSALAFLVQPSGTTLGIVMAPPVQVEIRDQFGNRETGSSAAVTLAIGSNPGGAVLSGGGPVTADAGVATFPALSLDKSGTGYTLNATSAGLPGTLSASFNISAGIVSASQSTVNVSPTTLTAGPGTALITVTARDPGGNPVTGATVTLAASGSGNTITQPATATNSGGVTTGTISSTGAGIKTISATASGVLITQKPTLTVTAGPVSASQTTVAANPASIEAGSGASTIVVTARDAFANPVSGASVTLAASGSGVTLTQPSAVTDATGVATGALAASSTGTKTVSATAAGVAVTQTATVTVLAPGSSVTFVGAGDIADCGSTDDEATAALINAMPGVPVFTLGDNAYQNGSTKDYANCYNPSWGAFKSRTHPSAGNHEYNTNGAAPYFAYFGAAAGPAGLGYYSFDLGAWHVIVLNSNIETGANSPQDVWLRADLAAHPNVCTLAYFHHPLYSSIGGTGSGGAVITSARRLWDDLYAAGADLILNGHRHVWERIAPAKPDGTADPVRGIRTIIAGMGGESGGDLTNVFPLSEAREGRTFGVLKLTLRSTSYDWQFIPVAGSTYTDSGTGSCH